MTSPVASPGVIPSIWIAMIFLNLTVLGLGLGLGFAYLVIKNWRQTGEISQFWTIVSALLMYVSLHELIVLTRNAS